jgi:hypothetical protein
MLGSLLLLELTRVVLDNLIFEIHSKVSNAFLISIFFTIQANLSTRINKSNRPKIYHLNYKSVAKVLYIQGTELHKLSIHINHTI